VANAPQRALREFTHSGVGVARGAAYLLRRCSYHTEPSRFAFTQPLRGSRVPEVGLWATYYRNDGYGVSTDGAT
jgi:hypothetical protein